MANFNRVILAGNMTRDPQLSYTPSNTAVCEFGMAVNRKWRDREGNSQDEVLFVDVIAYGRQAETINQYMTKGRPILIEGRLRYRQWTDKEGHNRSKLDVVVENFTFLGSGQGGGGGERPAPSGQGRGPGPRGGGQPPQRRPSPPPQEDYGVPDDEPPVGDADIPF